MSSRLPCGTSCERVAMSSYSRTVGGKLQLKGGLSLKPAKKHKKKKNKKEEKDEDKKEKKRDREQPQEPAATRLQLVKTRGSGRLLSSGTTLMGLPGCRFLQELSVGDAVVVQHPTSLREETRIVRMVLSDVSAGVSSAFSSDLVSSTPFQYIKAPPEDETREQQQQQENKKKKRKVDEQTAFGTYAGGTEKGGQITYRVKKSGAYGGYAIVKEVPRVQIITAPFILPLAIVLLQESIPLQDPKDGWKSNYGFWVRVGFIGAATAFALVDQVEPWLDVPGLSTRQTVFYCIGVGTGFVVTGMVVTGIWAFPVPFFMLSLSTVMVIVLLGLFRIIVGTRSFQCLLAQKNQLKQLNRIGSLQAFVSMVYPLYESLFMKTKDTTYELPVILILPISSSS
ncbi:unnamed protein product [Phytophthora fragariaefolia]|uniref:Unnamed protein product n=1 Tax=Phytophthora fragariaefolia TaxID=1490495 RepID=A0A9W6UB17_9STRA|nr:unnamed protein product [Phytophthora fragariaefolia]